MKLALLVVSAGLLTAQAPVLDFPMSMAVSREGRVLVLSGGAKASVNVMNGPSVPLEDAWLGLTIAPNGRTVYAGGGSRGSVYELSLSAEGDIKLVREMKVSNFIGDVAVSPDGRLVYAADVYANAVVVINPQSGRVINQFRTGRRPYRILIHPDGRSYFVSSWADASVYQYNATNGEEIGRIRLGPHTTDMILSDRKPPAEEGQPRPSWKYRLFVAAANTNDVFVVGVGESKTMQLVESIHVAPEVLTPLGMTPSALALSRDQTQLYVACSDANTVAAVDISDVRGTFEGFLQAGSYPTAIGALENGRILTLNGKGNSISVLDPQAIQSFTDSETPPLPAQPAQHVVYLLADLAPEDLMRTVAGIAPDYTVKLGYKQGANFDPGDPANTPPAGYIWTNALNAGLTVRNYGVFVRNGKVSDPGLAPHTNLRGSQGFVEDLKQFEATGNMPALLLVQANDPSQRIAISDALNKSRFAASTKIVEGGNLRLVEALLGLRPMTRKDP